MPDIISAILNQKADGISTGQITAILGGKKYSARVGSSVVSVTAAISDSISIDQKVIINTTDTGRWIIGILQNAVNRQVKEVIIRG